MTDAIDQIGAFAGLASFLGLAVLAFLYFMQARHVRDLEERATFLPDDVDLPATAPTRGKAPVAAATATQERKAGAPTAGAEDTIEAARQVEIARAAAERRARFQERRGGSGPFSGGGEGGGRGPDPRQILIIGLGVIVLAAGVIFGLGKITGGGDDSGGSTTASGQPEIQGTGAPVEVAVLNGTPVPGLAAKVGEEVREGGGFKLGAVTNTETPFDVTEVMFDPKDPEAQAKAQEVAGRLQVAAPTPISGEIKQAAEGAPIVVIVGEDRAGT